MNRDDLIGKILDQQKQIDQLQKELSKYKNPNTPPSANKHLKPNTQGKHKNGGKRGAPKGHKGTTRHQKPTKALEIDACTCPKCHGSNLKDKKIHKRRVEEVVEPPEPETIEANIHQKECKDCGYVFIPEDNTIPLKGKFGINLMVLAVFIRFILRGVLRKAGLFLETGFALRITPASFNMILDRVAKAAESEYNDIKMRIRLSKIVYVDETSFSVLGDNQWVWVFRTQNDILLVIRPSRGSDVLKEILGVDYAGTIVCDCWKAYNVMLFANLQRCWAHLLRKSEDLTDTLAGRHFHEKLRKLFKEIKEFNKSNPTESQRLEKYQSMTGELKRLITYYSRYEQLMPVVKYIDNNLGNWLTCVKIQGIEPTNNFAEQAIRETVMVRKIIGAFRSENGKGNYECLASILATWQLNGLEIKTELKKMLVRKLCFC
ncbi:MAG: IS66 family transposase [archaeon]